MEPSIDINVSILFLTTSCRKENGTVLGLQIKGKIIKSITQITCILTKLNLFNVFVCFHILTNTSKTIDLNTLLKVT